MYLNVQTNKKSTTKRNYRLKAMRFLFWQKKQFGVIKQCSFGMHTCAALCLNAKKCSSLILDKEVRHQMRYSSSNTYHTYKSDKMPVRTDRGRQQKIKLYTYIYCISY